MDVVTATELLPATVPAVLQNNELYCHYYCAWKITAILMKKCCHHIPEKYSHIYVLRGM